MGKHIFSGHAQLPNGSDLYESMKYLSVLMVVEMETGTILQSTIPLYCPMHSEFVSEILNGKSLDTDLEQIFKDIEKTVHTQTRRALITAIQTLHNRYIIVKNNHAKEIKA
ncbi:MAG: DUF3870 domain-containing protein [Clostridiales bacterium]|nr:DUF3870 domain-containing protein [Clostridiales bacterium]